MCFLTFATVAVRDCTDALSLDPSSAKAMVRRGIAYLNSERLEFAVEDLTAADAMLATTGFIDLQATVRKGLRWVQERGGD
jgi:hypothetical protein